MNKYQTMIDLQIKITEQKAALNKFNKRLGFQVSRNEVTDLLLCQQDIIENLLSLLISRKD